MSNAPDKEKGIGVLWNRGTPTERGHVLVVAHDEENISRVDTVNVYICPEYGNVILEYLDGEDYPYNVTHYSKLRGLLG